MHEQHPPHAELQLEQIPAEIADQATAKAEASAPERAEQLSDRPRIWVGSWLDYTHGVLHGDWIRADRDEAAIWADIQTMLAGSPTATTTGDIAEEWAIFDQQNFGPLRIGEQECLDWIATVGQGIAKHGPAFGAWADFMADTALLNGFAEAYLGHHQSVETYAEQLVDDLGYQDLIDQAIPESLRPYVQFNSAALARDMQLGGDMHAVPSSDGGVWIFDAR